MRQLRLVILGSGHGPHCYAGLAASLPDVHVTILSLTQGRRLKSIMDITSKTFHVTFRHYMPDGGDKVFTSKPDVVTHDPSLAIPGSDLIVFVVPSNTHERYFDAIAPYIQAGKVIIGLPGGAGWLFQAMDKLKEKIRNCYLISFTSLPWTCRVREFGSSAHILGLKDVIVGGSYGKSVDTVLGMSPVDTLQYTLMDKTECIVKGHLLSACLPNMNMYLHPSIEFGYWSEWDGKPVDTVPLFYHEFTKLGADTMNRLGNESLLIKKEILRQRPLLDMSQYFHIYDIFSRTYSDQLVDDKTSLYTMMRSGKHYADNYHPMIRTADGRYVPDFEHRYYKEDVSCGLVVVKGVALILGVETPVHDRVIRWAQRVMGKEYLVRGRLEGRDVGETRCPQRYGIDTLAGMLGEQSH